MPGISRKHDGLILKGQNVLGHLYLQLFTYHHSRSTLHNR